MEEVKHDIRSVLVSCKVPLTIKELSEQYKYLTGRPIEFAAFGYPDLECFIMDMPDVLDTVWTEGEVRLVCKRDLTDVTIESLINVLRHSKSSGGIVGSSIPKENPEIFIPRLWQDAVENIIKDNNNSMEIAALEKELERMQLRLSEKRLKLCGVLKRCFNFIVSDDKTVVSIRNERDILIELVQKILEDNFQGIDLDKLEIILQKKFKKNFSFKKFGFENAFQFFKYYSKYLTFLIEKDGHLKLFSKKHRSKTIPHKIETGNFHGIVTCVNSPSSFWVIDTKLLESKDLENLIFKENLISSEISRIICGKVFCTLTIDHNR